jgi:hypothetical protein
LSNCFEGDPCGIIVIDLDDFVHRSGNADNEICLGPNGNSLVRDHGLNLFLASRLADIFQGNDLKFLQMHKQSRKHSIPLNTMAGLFLENDACFQSSVTTWFREQDYLNDKVEKKLELISQSSCSSISDIKFHVLDGIRMLDSINKLSAYAQFQLDNLNMSYFSSPREPMTLRSLLKSAKIGGVGSWLWIFLIQIKLKGYHAIEMVQNLQLAFKKSTEDSLLRKWHKVVAELRHESEMVRALEVISFCKRIDLFEDRWVFLRMNKTLRNSILTCEDPNEAMLYIYDRSLMVRDLYEELCYNSTPHTSTERDFDEL